MLRDRPKCNTEIICSKFKNKYFQITFLFLNIQGIFNENIVTKVSMYPTLHLTT